MTSGKKEPFLKRPLKHATKTVGEKRIVSIGKEKEKLIKTWIGGEATESRRVNARNSAGNGVSVT